MWWFMKFFYIYFGDHHDHILVSWKILLVPNKSINWKAVHIKIINVVKKYTDLQNKLIHCTQKIVQNKNRQHIHMQHVFLKLLVPLLLTTKVNSNDWLSTTSLPAIDSLSFGGSANSSAWSVSPIWTNLNNKCLISISILHYNFCNCYESHITSSLF